MPSGLPLARAIEQALLCSPGANVFVLGNHGLVVCGEDCDSAETLLSEVESHLAITARRGPEPSLAVLAEMAAFPQCRLPETTDVHILATDAISRRMLRGGVLYPCQAVFLGAPTPLLPNSAALPLAMERFESEYGRPPFWIVEERGVAISEGMARTQYAVLSGLMQVVQRIEASAAIRYITDAELADLLSADAYRYRQSVEHNAIGPVSW